MGVHLKLGMCLALGRHPNICLCCGSGVICVLRRLLLTVASRVIKAKMNGQGVKAIPEVRH